MVGLCVIAHISWLLQRLNLKGIPMRHVECNLSQKNPIYLAVSTRCDFCMGEWCQNLCY